MFFLEMILAVLVFFGIALLFRSICHVNTGEGSVLAVAAIALLLVLSSFWGSFIYGIYASELLAVLGGIFWIVKVIRTGKRELAETFSPAFVVLIALYLASLVLLYHDFIQHIDELHHWALAVKVMLNTDQMPSGMSVSNSAYATSLFLLFFQKFTGYNEQGMYVAAIFLAWIGFMLPFSNYRWKDWKKVAVYSVIVYIALFTLYTYGIKSLYADVPLAAWSGGLVGWWTKREKKRVNLVIVCAGLVLLHFFKASEGLLMAVFVLLFLLLQSLIVEKGRMEETSFRTKFTAGVGILCLFVLVGSGALMAVSVNIKPYQIQEHQEEENSSQDGQQEWMIAGQKLPTRVSTVINIVGLSGEKVKRTFGSFVTKCVGGTLASRSNWKIGYVPFLVLIFILFKIVGDLYRQQKKEQAYILYGIFMALSYSMTVFFSYLFMFAYELSVEVRSISRYFSACVIYLFVLALSELLQQERTEKENAFKYVVLGVTVFFAMGLNDKFIPNATAINKTKISGYDKLNSIGQQIEEVESIIGEHDRVYYICQYPADNLGDAELYNASVSYYMEDRASDYLATPWKFTSEGSNVRLEKSDVTLAKLPELLEQGGYTYLWVHTTNAYLTRELPLVMKCETVKSGYLYKVRYENGKATGLELVRELTGSVD